jgi:hypothetical protein
MIVDQLTQVVSIVESELTIAAATSPSSRHEVSSPRNRRRPQLWQFKLSLPVPVM